MEKSKINDHRRSFVVIPTLSIFFVSILVSYFFIKSFSKIYKDKQYADITTCYDELEMQVYPTIMKSCSKILPVVEIVRNNGELIFEHGAPLGSLMTDTDIIGFMYAPDTVVEMGYPKNQISDYIGLDLCSNFPERIDEKILKQSDSPLFLGPFIDQKTNKRIMVLISAISEMQATGRNYKGSVIALVDCDKMMDNIDFSLLKSKNIVCKLWQHNEYTGKTGMIFESETGFDKNFMDEENLVTFQKLYFTTPFSFSFISKYDFYHSRSFRVVVILDLIFCIILTVATFYIARGFLHSEELKLYKVQSKLVTVQEHIINSLSSLVENRDNDTGSHVQRTSDYVYMIAKQAKLSKVYNETLTDEYIEMLRSAAPMHDIGKIVIPDAILKKPGKLEPEEFEQIKRHTTEGAKIVNDIIGPVQTRDFVKITQEIAESHHEKWNGTGYPYGLKETDIPLSARIMALADVFDALTTPRCYKAPFSFEKAVAIIAEGSGTQFDPKLTDVFLANQDKLKEILSRYFKVD